MDKKSLMQFKKLLLEEKQRILNNSRNTLKNELNISTDDLPDETDLASVELSQSMVFKLRERERVLLVKIDEALARIDNGSFGICEETGEPIEHKRLLAMPWTTLSLEGAETREKESRTYAHKKLA